MIRNVRQLNKIKYFKGTDRLKISSQKHKFHNDNVLGYNYKIRSIETYIFIWSRGVQTDSLQFPSAKDEKGWHIQNFEDRLFNFLSDGKDRLSVPKFKAALAMYGLRETDPRLKESMDNLNNVQTQADLHGLEIDRATFKDCINDNVVLIAKAFHNNFIIPDFIPFREQIDEMYWSARSNTAGRVANYIPQLSRISPDNWAISICTVDGQRHSIGDYNVPFCLQSTSKPLIYALVQEELNPETAHNYVGHEPSGRSFNEISLDAGNKPHNPMINSGAIVMCSLLKNKLNLADRFDYVTKTFKRLTGGEYLAFNNSV